MPVPRRSRLTSLRCGAAMTLLAVVAVPATALAASSAGTAGTAGTARSTAGSAGTATTAATVIRHFNVGATHSPQLLRQLAGAGSGPALPAATPLLHPALDLGTASALPVLAGAVQGVDVASYQEQGGIGWAQVAAAAIQFAAIKVTEGDYYVNPYASADLTAAKAAGLTTLAYAFAIPNGGGYSASPVVQADDLVAAAAGPDGTVPPVMLDIEYDPYDQQDGTNECYGLTPSAMTAWISGFVDEIVARTGRPPAIYSTQGWWEECTGGSTAFGQYPLWIANYATTAGTLPAGWSTWNLWQYTSAGTVAGIPDPGDTDLDQLNPATLTLLNPGLQQSAAGAGVSLQLSASIPGLAYSATGLPPGLTLDAGTGQVTGTAPATPGAYPVTVTATGAGTAGVSGATASVSFTWDVHGTLALTGPGSRSTVAGGPVDLQLLAADSAAGQQASFTVTGLPAGLSATAAGLVTGWPDRPGSYHVTVTGHDSLGAAAAVSFTWTVSVAPDRGAAGPVASALDGKCLEDVGSKPANGTQAGLWPCTGSSSQHWTYAQDGSLRIHGRCLTAPGSKAASGQKVVLESCTGAARQQWRLAYPRAKSASLGASPTTVVNPWSRMCLADASRASGSRAVIRPCAGTASQSWTMPSGPLTSQVAGKCLDDAGDRTTSGNKIDLWPCDGKAGQRWTTEPGGTVRIHGKCLGVSPPGTASGNAVGLYSCDGAGTQLWHLTPKGAGVALVNPASDLCLADPGNATANGTALVIATCAAVPGEHWRAS